MRKKLTLILLALILMGKGYAQKLKSHINEVPDTYNFWFLDPEEGNHDPNAHFPLVIFLHGASLCGNDLNKVKRYGPIQAMEKGLYITSYLLAPQNPGGKWWNPEKIWKIVEWAKEHYAVDSTRIYVYGMSLGGYGTIDMAAAYPDKIAAAMALCGGGTLKDLSGLSKVPLWIIHGTADRAVAFSESEKVVKAIKETGDDSRLIFTKLVGADHGRPSRLFYMNMTYDWMSSHCLLDEGRPVSRDFEVTDEGMNNAYRDMKWTEPEYE